MRLFFIAIGSALSPDYAYSSTHEEHLEHEREKFEMDRPYEPKPVDTTT